MKMQTPDNSSRGKSGFFTDSPDRESIQSFYAKEDADPLTHAFDRKIAVHAGFGGRPIAETDRPRILEEFLSRPRRKKTAVYIHVPFCESHCLYCGFYNRAFGRDDSAQFTDALLQEMTIWEKKAAVQQGPIHAVYIGGGTPTVLEAGDLKRLLTHVRSAFPLTNDCEITVEGRIHNFGPEKMEACLDGGANRFSLGVQTFFTHLRQSMRRIDDRDTIFRSLAALRDFDRAVVVIDLIYGFPSQTMEMWRQDIGDFLTLDLDGVDLYQLNVFDQSPLANAIERGDFSEAADIPVQGGMFAEGVRIMEAARYRRLSVTHWGRTTRERNIYNHMMKGPSECLAYGPGAGGSLNGHFYFVNSDYKKWLSYAESGEKSIAVMMAPRPFAELDKVVAAGFDLGRLDLRRVESERNRLKQNGSGPDATVREILSPLLEQWARAGLINPDGDWVDLTVAGQFWGVNLAQLTINYLHQQLQKELNK